jgi:hypothetical protein
MPIELRFDNTGMGRVVVACHFCGEDIADPGEGLAVWVPGDEPDPVEGTTFRVEYAHRGCEERFQEGPLWAAKHREVANKINLPLAELFDSLRQPLTPGAEG